MHVIPMMQITDTEEAGEIASIEFGQEMYDTTRSSGETWKLCAELRFLPF